MNGEYITYYRSGDILSKCNYIDSKKNGEYIEYYMTGEIDFIETYSNGKMNGTSISYYISGEIYSIYYYIDNNRVSDEEWLSYNRNLILESIGL